MYTSGGPSSGVGQLLIRCQFWRGPYHVSLPRAHHVPLLYNKIRLTERPAILRFSRRRYRCGAALARYAQVNSRALAVGSRRTWDEARLEWHRPCRGHRAGPIRPVLLLQREDRRTVRATRDQTARTGTKMARSCLRNALVSLQVVPRARTGTKTAGSCLNRRTASSGECMRQ